VIAAAVFEPGVGSKIHLIGLDGSGSSVLPGTDGAQSAQWSSNSSRIVFVNGFRPYVYELATGSVTRIIDAETQLVAWLE
jgi:Tol biopolymer transport system component